MDRLKQIEALATYQGWTRFHTYEDNQGPDLYCGYPPKTFKETFKQEHKHGCQLPNYYDLNVLRQIELQLTEKQLYSYIYWCLVLTNVEQDIIQSDNLYTTKDLIAFLNTPIDKRIAAILLALDLWEGNPEEYFLK